jgi:hypothetical protein
LKTPRDLKLTQKVALQQGQLVSELQVLVKDIEWCEKTMAALRQELEGVNAKHAGRQTTLEDIHYLEDLLACAKKKLIWEKHMASVQKRTPALMERVESLVNHPQSDPDETTRTSLLESLRNVQAAMGRLKETKL